jgi:autotransporter-associated beta strand protein
VLTASIPAGATAMQVRWGQEGSNDYWWAIDNVSIKGNVDRWAFEGIADDTTVAFTTMADIIPDLSAAAPADGSTTFAVDGDITLTFDTAVKVGNGYVHIVDAATGAAVESISVRSAAVTVNDQTVTINPAGDLTADTAYQLLVDRGAFLGTTTTSRAGVPLLLQDFELLALGAAVTETGGDGTDWTATPPTDWAVDNSAMADGGVPEYRGWTFVDKDAWNTWSGQGRDSFTLASGTVAVADTDEFDDVADAPPFNSLMVTPEIDLSAVTGSEVAIEFDSSFRPEGGGGGAASGNQTGLVEVTFDGGTTWTNLLTLDGDSATGDLTDPSVNRHESLMATIPAGATTMQVRWGQEGSNDYWWAIDNVVITATVDGYEFAGLEAGALAFTTAPASNDVVVDVGDGQTVTDTTVYTGDQVIVKTGNGTLILNLANSHTGGLRVEAGTVIIQNAAALNSGPLVINAGATVKLDVGFNLVPLSSLTLDAAGLLDVGTGGITVADGGFSAADIRSALISGRNGGAWDGTTGIMFTAQSATAAATAFSVGYSIDGNGLLTARYTADGDAQLDGKVNFDDILALFPNYDGTGTYVWSDGDFTYDGKVNFDDILALFPNYDTDAVFGAGLPGQGGGSGSGNGGDGGDNGTSSLQSTGTGPDGDGAADQPLMGPAAPADLPMRTVTTLSRSGSLAGESDATSLAFAALASDELSGSASADKKKSVFATL